MVASMILEMELGHQIRRAMERPLDAAATER
jgi:hypothetical protein